MATPSDKYLKNLGFVSSALHRLYEETVAEFGASHELTGDIAALDVQLTHILIDTVRKSKAAKP